MSKPAPKEPSMDEILSSIRQIIADDDAASGPRTAPQPGAANRSDPMGDDLDAPEAEFGDRDDEALALSPDQILSEDEDQPRGEAVSFEDLIEGDEDEEGSTGPEEQAASDEEETSAHSEAEADFVADPDIAGTETTAIAAPADPDADNNPSSRRGPKVGQTAPLPDPTLSKDIANQLIEPVTNATVRHTFSKLSETAIGAKSATVEGMLRDTLRETLRPMLQEWLDENLPMIVESLVEKEIARISRGVE